jgi:hypothetical protein
MKVLAMLLGSRRLTRSRLTLLVATVVVVLGTLAGLGVLFLNPARAAVGPLPAASLVLPADSRFVIGFDVRRFTASPFYVRYGSRPAMRPQAFTDLEQKTGLDLARDVSQVVVAGTGLGRDADVLALAIGHFDSGKLARALEGEGRARPYRHQGATLWILQPPAGQASKPPRAAESALAFLGRDALVLGSRSRVEAAVRNQARGLAPLRSNALLVSLAEKVRPGATFWMVGDGTLVSALTTSMPASGMPGGGAALNLPALRSLSVTGDLDPLVSLALTGVAADEPGARNLADLVRGLVALAALQAQQNPELQQLASAVSVATEANRVLVTARIPYPLLDALLAGAQRRRPAPPHP